MGVAAVPGSGKTQTLSYLAALLINEGHIEDDQEILVVTLVNSAVENFSSRIAGFVKDLGLLPGIGYRVRTLHGLAHDIVRERPDLAGLGNDFRIIDDHESAEILANVAATWQKSHPDWIAEWTRTDLDPFHNPIVNRSWAELIRDIGNSVIRLSKDLRASPDDIRSQLDDLQTTAPILEMGWEIYTDYQQALRYRSAVDFDDLIMLALRALKSDPDFLERLRRRWPFILEDEAQDSSRIQEQILRLLSGPSGNWVRVGDPNQAIFETFTTASPRFLKNFMEEPEVIARTLPNSGRSSTSIISLANELILWTRSNHPNPALRDALSLPLIERTPPNDPQPNPASGPESVILYPRRFQPDEELETVARSLKKWLAEHPQGTVAVLVPRNERGAKLVDVLKAYEIPYLELLRSSLPTRETAGALGSILTSLSEPASSTRLAEAYAKIRQAIDTVDRQVVQQTTATLRKMRQVEDFLWPHPDHNWIMDWASKEVSPEVLSELKWIQRKFCEWQSATILPIDQLILTIAQSIFSSPADLALAHKIALSLENVAENHPEWGLPQFSEELHNIAQNKRKFAGFSDEDNGFDPDHYPGKVIVATIHKAKGLEWDRVHLVSASNYDFPSAMPEDSFISEKWFLNQTINLQAEAVSKLIALLNKDIPGIYNEALDATVQARVDYAAERLRLLYVGITRARKELVITWNAGRGGNRSASTPSLALAALQAYWDTKTISD